MIGILHVLITSTARMAKGRRDSLYARDARERAIEKGERTYSDYYGVVRNVATGNRVFQYHKDDASGDTVQCDSVTGEIIHRFPNYEKQREIKFENKTSEAKTKAMANGDFAYCETQNCPYMIGGKQVWRRLSDDLELMTDKYGNINGNMTDKEHHLFLGYVKRQPVSNVQNRVADFNKMVDKNLMMINDDNYWSDVTMSYARKVGAITEHITEEQWIERWGKQ